jgi:hypothetical protein
MKEAERENINSKPFMIFQRDCGCVVEMFVKIWEWEVSDQIGESVCSPDYGKGLKITSFQVLWEWEKQAREKLLLIPCNKAAECDSLRTLGYNRGWRVNFKHWKSWEEQLGKSERLS